MQAPNYVGDRHELAREIERVMSTDEKWAALRVSLRRFIDATFAAWAAASPEQREVMERAHVFAVWQFANDPSFPLPLRRLQ